ncbi:GNAT family N-acetyltransferase [Pontibacter liquoris]|uniref:GNAT family N-acetyltransferase n=1 Tax=Pontibacter liquoris TaxID=2905677 RepID=UPI001FA80787|nr:GNAT family N-acetyltransferase [Pontibacter liquoris]
MPMYHVTRIQHGDHPHLPALQQLYEMAFVEEQRRTLPQLQQLLSEPNMHVHALLPAGRFAGFSIHWQFDDFLFLEHLSIIPPLRGMHLGERAIQWLLAQTNVPIILEVEAPTDKLSTRRVGFYERLGFTLHDSFPYQQPPYQRHGQPVPLVLMTSPPMLQPAELEDIVTKIREQVYERFYEPSA